MGGTPLSRFSVIEVLPLSEHVRTEVLVKSGFHCIIYVEFCLFLLLLGILNQGSNKTVSELRRTYLFNYIDGAKRSTTNNLKVPFRGGYLFFNRLLPKCNDRDKNQKFFAEKTLQKCQKSSC